MWTMLSSGGRWSHAEGTTGHLVMKTVVVPNSKFRMGSRLCNEAYRVAQVSGMASLEDDDWLMVSTDSRVITVCHTYQPALVLVSQQGWGTKVLLMATSDSLPFLVI